MQRLVTFNVYFFGFLVLDRMSFFGNPPSTTESWVMALVLGLAVTLISPLVARILPHRAAVEDMGLIRIESDRMPSHAVDPDLRL